KPAKGMTIQLLKCTGDKCIVVTTTVTNSDGRCDVPLLINDSMQPADYQLLFHVGDYFRLIGNADADRFLKIVPIQFTISDASANYHVPLLVSPWAYSTYRGS
ncbi:MAG: hydroxyisourate hydrolase, partial [Chthoniobacterales bacterium]|nr:hydroxyisourate hydrolase [Chthoniobacterales bacterium]